MQLSDLSGKTLVAPQEGPQTWLIQCPFHEIFWGGARGGGKTYGIMLDWLAHHGKYSQHARGIIFRRSLQEFKDFLRKSKLVFPALGWELKIAANTWVHLESKAELLLCYLESDKDAAGYMGSEYTWMGFDEVTNWPSSEPIDLLRACLRSAVGVPTRVVFTGNPGGAGHEWVKERYIDGQPPLTPFQDKITKHWMIFIPSTMEDNKLLMINDPDYEKRIFGVGATSAHLVQAWRYGDWNVSVFGNIFKREWWKFYNWNPEFIFWDNPPIQPPVFEFILQSWDTAVKAKRTSDWSVCTTWGITANGFYLLDVWREKANFSVVKKAVYSQARKWRAKEVLIEDKASGPMLYQELMGDRDEENPGSSRLPIRMINPVQDKETRAHVITPLISAGRVWLPSPKLLLPWLNPYIDELASFPKGAKDDQVDSTTQALDRLSHWGDILDIDWQEDENEQAEIFYPIFQR